MNLFCDFSPLWGTALWLSGSDGPGVGQKKGDELCVQFRHIFKDMLSLDARCQQGWGALIRHPGGAIQYILHRLPGRESLQYD